MAQRISGITYKQYNEELRTDEQVLAEKLLMSNKHFVLGWEPGKSKSYPVVHCIRLVQRLKPRPIKVLIMSNAACIRDMWKVDILPQGILPNQTYFVTDRTAIGNVKPALLKTKWDIIIVDECQSLRSGVTRGKSKFAKLVHKLTSTAEYVWGMTGTLSGNNDIEPWCVLHNLNIADQGKLSPILFKNKYCILETGYGPFGNFQRPTKLNYTGQALMTQCLAKGVMFSDYSEEEMPPHNVNYKVFKVNPTKEYKNALDGILKLGMHESTVLKAQALMKAQQALNGFIYYEDEFAQRQTYYIPDYHNPKLDYISNYCKSTITIIVYRFQEDELSIKAALDVIKVKYTKDITDFKNRVEAGEHIILVLQCTRGSAANIQCCQNIIYYSADFSFINYKQMIHRCWRRGQTETCNVVFLINDPGDKHRVEEKIWEALRYKQSLHDTLIAIKQIY